MTLLESIARMEGWLDPHSRCRRNNNPGNIEAGRFAVAHGATGSDGRFAIFPTADAGFAALRALLAGPAYRDKTVEQMLHSYAPPCENNTTNYLECVCTWSGCHANELVVDALTET